MSFVQIGGPDIVFDAPSQPPGDIFQTVPEPDINDKGKAGGPSSTTTGKAHTNEPPKKPGATTDFTDKDNGQGQVIPTSGLTKCQKARLPLGTFGTFTVYGSLLAQPVVWISVFGTNPTIIGVINTVMTFYDIASVPYFGQFSDEGRFNFLCFKDVTVWGRRAPLALMSLPANALGFWFNWVGPENYYGEQVTLGVWFFMVRFVISTALGGMFLTANAAAFSEIFPNVKERVNMASYKGIASGLGVMMGAGALTTAAISVEDDPGSPEQKQIYLCIGIILMLCIAMWLPWSLLMSKSVMTETCVREPMSKVVRYVWASGNSVKVLALSMNLYTAAANMVIPFVTFFLRQCFGLSVKEAAAGQTLCVVVYSLLYVVGFPLAAYFNHRYHPVTCIVGATLSADVFATLGGLLALYLKDNVNLCIIILGFSLGSKGLPGATVNLARQVLTCWVIDEDLVAQCELRQQGIAVMDAKELPPRRDGAFNAFIMCAVRLGSLSTGVCQILMGLLGYEASRDADNIMQPTAVQHFLLAIFLIGHPLCSTASWVVLYWFPLKGDKLSKVNRKYATLFNMKMNNTTASTNGNENGVAKEADAKL